VTGVSDASVWRGLVICTVVVGLILWLAWRWLKSGYRMKA
jgi:ABC-2 type transport system permease protein